MLMLTENLQHLFVWPRLGPRLGQVTIIKKNMKEKNGYYQTDSVVENTPKNERFY